MSKNLEKLIERLKRIAQEMQNKETANDAFYRLLSILDEIDLDEILEIMDKNEVVFFVVCELCNYIHNLKANFGCGCIGFPKNEINRFFSILENIGKFIQNMLDADQKEIAKILIKLYVDYYSLLEVTEDALQEDPDQDFICID